ncbi:MAG: YdcF family protein [Nitrospinae bacterium]|nr:YdcF family protein [Nitrospinota bacterium]
MSAAPYSDKCDYILLLPGGGIPSPSMLLRSYKAAEEFKKNPSAKVVISLKTGPALEQSTSWDIRNELVLRGVPVDSVIFERQATSTAEHAKYIREQNIGDPAKNSYLIVTSPSHIMRSMASFKAAGFKNIYASPAYSAGEKEDLGGGQLLRYDFWSALETEVEIAREFTALAYYKLTGRA